MKRTLILQILLLPAAFQIGLAIQAPTGLVSRTGDQSIVLHWDRNTEANLAGYRVYRSTTGAGGPFSLQNPSLLTAPGFCDLTSKVINGQTNFYYVTAVDTSSQESLPSATLGALPHPFASDDEFLEYVQETSFDYFWYGANPANGLVPDRSATGSACSIAAVGFGLTAIGIGVDHGWITRTQAVARVLTTLNTFLSGPQGPGNSGIIGYKGWFYHFLDMNTALRSGSELSSIDTVLLLAGILYAKQYFNGASAEETSIRAMADAIFNRVDWTWMAQGTDVVSMGWYPGSGFISANWIGYNEAMILYCLGLGTATNPLPASAWSRWTSGYTWGTYYGQTFIPFSPLFGHQYSHCWIDFRHIADSYMNSHNSTYFENSRRAALAQVQYAVLNPGGFAGYSSTIWGLTACDGPTAATPSTASRRAEPMMARLPRPRPAAPCPSHPNIRCRLCAPSIAASARGFGRPMASATRSTSRPQWYATDELGIDQGPIVIMIENYRNQRVWQLFMQNAEVQRGLQRAGFVPLPFLSLNLQPVPALGAFNLCVERLRQPLLPGRILAATADLDGLAGFRPGHQQRNLQLARHRAARHRLRSRPPRPQRFYRVFQLGSP